ncbi:RIP metalloprotease RseP [Legionella impletisoli]|uniref:Zinc metalloprotease n=1 Tax=Legionella impletisoli TaxID=343510 RepID=A0A917JWK4_9GAMM|nr:RIP metalloprotease RseP [Legionella impletisoli]GGI89712.1 zinc metalloprotease [Legionella impletisoli]
MWTAFYFILALFILIVVHEYGHFIVARLCGVKVLRFSFGFGKILFSWKGKKGTEYAWSVFPLGGYVKMLDETEGEVPEHERHLAFNNKPLWKKVAVVIAGPFFNFLFAFFALWLMWVIGFKSLAPMIEEVKPGSIAYLAGLKPNYEILALGDESIDSWRDFQYAIMPYLGSDASINLKVKSLNNGAINTVTLPLKDWQVGIKKPDLLKSLGIVPFVPSIPPVVGEVVKDAPASKAGLRVGDKITAINGKTITDWLELVEFVQEHPAQTIQLEVMRGQKTKTIPVTIGLTERQGEKEGFLGVKSQHVDWPKRWLRVQQKDPFHAVGKSFSQTMELTGATFVLLGRLAIGKLPIQSLSGPVGIAQGAGESARGGLSYYLSFLALVSISLAVLNLLPIPVLDGGHLLYYLIEAIRGKPLSEEVKSAGMYLGLLLLMALMVVALSNDISRLMG